MIRSSRILYLICAIIIPGLIGLLHTQAHFQYLTTPAAKSALQIPIPIYEVPIPAWNTWGLMSFMMGIGFIIMSAQNLIFYRQLAKQDPPTLPMYLTMLAYLGAVIYVGITFHAMPQFYGGLFGLGLLGISWGMKQADRSLQADT